MAFLSKEQCYFQTFLMWILCISNDKVSPFPLQPCSCGFSCLWCLLLAEDGLELVQWSSHEPGSCILWDAITNNVESLCNWYFMLLMLAHFMSAALPGLSEITHFYIRTSLSNCPGQSADSSHLPCSNSSAGLPPVLRSSDFLSAHTRIQSCDGKAGIRNSPGCAALIGF